MVDVDFTIFNEFKEELEDYDGYVPMLIRPFLTANYYTNLTRKGLLDKVLDIIDDRKLYSFKEQQEELTNWIKENPQYKEILL